VTLTLSEHGHTLWAETAQLRLLPQDSRSGSVFVERVYECVEMDGKQMPSAKQLERRERLGRVGVMSVHEIARLGDRQ
jgi:hypothetical protein